MEQSVDIKQIENAQLIETLACGRAGFLSVGKFI
jgi:hypothetical protein